MEEKRSWTVVKFIGENSVEAVPSTWIKNNTCYWPPYNAHRLASAICYCEIPDKEIWKSYNIAFFRNSTYDLYEVARKKARKATETSELDSDSEDDRHKRKRKPIVYSSSDEIDEGESILASPPRINSNVFNEETNKASTITEDAGPTCNWKRKEATKKSETITEVANPTCNWKRKEKTSKAETIADVYNPFNEDPDPTCNCCPLHKEIDYLKQIIRKQNIIQGMLSQVMEDITGLKNVTTSSAVVQEPNSIFNMFNLPIDEEEELNRLERYLSDEHNFKITVNEISRIGGNTPYDFIRRTLSKIVTNNLASQYSWFGAKKKKVFGKLKFSSLLIDSALKNSLTKDVTNKEIEEAIKNWLRRSKERHEAKSKTM